MSDNVISVLNTNAPSGLSNSQFRRIDQVYSLAASRNLLPYRSVNCDFDKGVMTICLSKSAHHTAFLSFIAVKVGPQTTIYELYREGKGRIARSALFDRVFEKYRDEVGDLLESQKG